MKVTDKQIKEFETTYNKCMKNLVDDVVEYRKRYVKALREADLKYEHDYSDVANDSFLHNVRKFYEHYQAIEAAVIETKKLINPDY